LIWVARSRRLKCVVLVLRLSRWLGRPLHSVDVPLRYRSAEHFRSAASQASVTARGPFPAPSLFVFRVNQDLYYAPVFFINGSIKGTDLFYRHTTKSFVPLNERWVEYLISLSETSEGRGVPISERTNTRRQLNLQAVVSPPDTMMARKYASAAWDEIKSAALTDLPQESILRKFITHDGGFGAITKIANAARENPDFAQALFTSSKPENYMPDLESYQAPAPEPMLTLHRNLLNNANVKSASTEDLNKGYVFEDNRPKEALNEVIYEASERNLRSVTEPGVYQMLVADGAMHEMLCA